MTGDILLEARGIKKYFPIEKGFIRKVVGVVKAVDDVWFKLYKGETLGLVGESGCGKTTLARCILRAIEPTDGEVFFYGDPNNVIDIASVEPGDLRLMRKNFQMIFQDPYASLSPRMTVMDIISEPLISMNLAPRREMRERVTELMKQVGLDENFLHRYPHAFSGGQRQRIGIARALASNPQLVVADEPVSALDVSVQAQILNLLKDLQSQFALSMLFISHNLGVVRHICDRVSVMYLGRIVETASTDPLYENPLHPYTQALLSAVPSADASSHRIILAGELPDPAHLPSGCVFHPRCLYCMNICKRETPEYREAEPGHFVSCHIMSRRDGNGEG